VLKERARIVAYWVWTMDLVLTALAFLLAWWLRSHVAPLIAPSLFPTELYPLSRYLGLLPLVLAIWKLELKHGGHGEPRSRHRGSFDSSHPQEIPLRSGSE